MPDADAFETAARLTAEGAPPQTPGARLHLGLSLPTWDDEHGRPTSWAHLRDLARLAEEAGVDFLGVADHLLPGFGGRPTGFWECWTVLSAVAAVTSRVTLGPFVACTAFRPPALLAKMADTLDEVCGGRLLLGLGAGVPDLDASFPAFGYPGDHPAGRFAEAVEIVARLLRGERVDFAGRYHRVQACELRPRGPRPAGPPICVGAKGPRMLRLAARWADVFSLNLQRGEPGEVAEPFARLDAACRAAGRDPATLPRTVSVSVTFAGPGADMTGARARALRGSPAAIARQLRAFHAAGASLVKCSIDAGDERGPLSRLPVLTARGLERFAPVIEALRGLEARA